MTSKASVISKSNRKSSIWHFFPVFIVAVVTAAATIATWYLIYASERRAHDHDFIRRAGNQANVIQNRSDDHWLKLYALRALFDSAEHPVTRDEFEHFAKSLIADDPAIMNVAWAPRVTREERPAHESSAVNGGLKHLPLRYRLA